MACHKKKNGSTMQSRLYSKKLNRFSGDALRLPQRQEQKHAGRALRELMPLVKIHRRRNTQCRRHDSRRRSKREGPAVELYYATVELRCGPTWAQQEHARL